MKQLILLGTFLITTSLSVLNQTKEDDKEKFDDEGHRIFSKAETLPFLEQRAGSFIRLSDSSLFLAKQNTCEVSKDEGKTWTEFPLLDPEKYKMGGALSLKTSKGTIIIGFSNVKELSPLNWNGDIHCYDPNANLPAYMIRSKDNGKTWSEPVKLHDNWTGANRGLIETKDGHIVFSTMLMRNNPGRHCVLTYVSSDDGVTWKQSNVLDSPSSVGDHAGMMEASIIELKDGRLWMLIRTNWDYFYESYSSDHGLTWSAYDKTNIDASSAPSALVRLQSGRIVLVWNRLYHKGKNEINRLGGDSKLSGELASWQRDELSLMYSDDDGKTWSTPIIIAANKTPSADPWKNWIAYPFMFEQAKGVIWITSSIGYGNLKIAIRE